MKGRKDFDIDDKNPETSPFHKVIPFFMPRLVRKTFGFTKKDLEEINTSLAQRLSYTSLIGSAICFLIGIVFFVFVAAKVWTPHKLNIYNTTGPWVMIIGGAVGFTLLLYFILSADKKKAALIVGDLSFRLSMLAALLLFFTADIINGDLSQTDSITGAVGMLMFLVICQPGYLAEMIAYNLLVFFSLLGLTIFGAVAYDMYSLDQYILFLLCYLLVSYIVYSSYWYNEGLRHYNLNRNAELLFRSTHDSLTSARNRQGLRFYLDERLPGYMAKNESLLVVIFDIDDFKLYNDTFGHLEGDKVLVEIVRAIEASPDVHHVRIFRYGGEEFVLLRSKVTREEAEVFLEAVRKAVEDLHFPAPLGSSGSYLTISLGGSLWNVGPDYAFHDQIADADQALYEAKGLGKNRYVLRSKLAEKPKEVEQKPEKKPAVKKSSKSK